ncbi:hypothetical protein [Bacillus sp. X1(2014)]|nr:hypothetical protein [Bacillus sp. X1(2014)]
MKILPISYFLNWSKREIAQRAAEYMGGRSCGTVGQARTPISSCFVPNR